MIGATIKSMLSIAKVLIRSKYSLMFDDFSAKSGKNVLLLGNGPSLNTQWEDIQAKRDKLELIVVNKFALGPQFIQLKPDHYVLLDDAFFNFTEDIFNDPSKHSLVKVNPVWTELQEQLNVNWRNILNSDWPICVWVPFIYRKSFIIEKLKAKGIKVQFFNYTVVDGWIMPLLFRLKLGLPQSQNVVNAAMGIGIWMKPKRLYLSGLDHTFHLDIKVDEDNYLVEHGAHFYNKQAPKVQRKLIDNHTHKRVTLFDMFTSLAKVHVAYRRLNMLAQKSQVDIYNVTNGGYVDTYERIPVSEIV